MPDGAPHTVHESVLGRRNLIAYSRALTRWSGRGALEEDDAVVLCAGGTWIPVVGNVAFRTDDAVDPARLLSRADRFFTSLGRGFTVKVRDSGQDEDLRVACVEAGLQPFGEPAPEMIRRAPVPELPTVSGTEVRVVDDLAGLRAFQDVNAAAYATYGMPPEVLDDLFDESARVLADPDVHIVVARRGPEALATALAYESDGVASLQWVGTVPSARGSGLGALVTAAAANLALARGASSVTLQASVMGEPVYERLGFDTLYRWAEYVRWPRAPRP